MNLKNNKNIRKGMHLIMLNRLKALLIVLIISIIQGCTEFDIPDYPPPRVLPVVGVDYYLTSADGLNLLALTTDGIFPLTTNNNPTITVNPNETFQTMDGFGYALTGGSAMLINSLSASIRADLLQELFGNGENSISLSYLRISIGSSDLDAETFSYVDLADGQTDSNLDNFSLSPDRTNLIPVLNEILDINPEIKILGTPWSAPKWMKTNGSTIGGELLPEYYGSYANYFVKYIQGMAAEGIIIDAITVQNEPENPFNNPSMLMDAEQQKTFIRDHLGPAFQDNNIQTKIILFDHNCDNPNFPISILNDFATKNFVDGSAFHLYDGQIGAMSLVHNAHPDKNLYFTEQAILADGNLAQDLGFHVREILIGASRNWSKNVLQWNLAADPNHNPHTNGGCFDCLGAITINANTIERNRGYYIMAHASKFVPPGSERIASNDLQDFPNVAYKTPQGDIVVIVLNANATEQRTVNINAQQTPITLTLPAGAAATLIWNKN